MEGVFDLELGSEMRSFSRPGSSGDLEGGCDVCDICDSGRDEGKEAREVLRLGNDPFE